MKELWIGIVLIVLFGIGGFFYRNTMERPIGGVQGVCSMEAKLCPDGSSVGRIGPSCSFAPCPEGILLGTTPEMIAIIPEGYVENTDPNVDMATGGDMSIVREFLKPSSSGTVSHTIRLYDLGVDATDTTLKDIEDDIVRSTVFYPAYVPATSIDQFVKIVLGGRTYYSVVIERFEGTIHSEYYLPVETPSGGLNLYSFSVIEHDVVSWTDPDLDLDALPEHSALHTMLGTLQAIP